MGTSGGTSAIADLVVRNAKVTTLDPEHPHCEGFAVGDGLILATGTDREISRFVGPETRLVDALGRRVIPGLNDSHLHIIRGGRMYGLETRWDGVGSLAEGLRLLSERAATSPPGQWVRVIGGWSEFQFEERRMPTLAEINRATGDVPAFVMHLYQGGMLNQAAIRYLGWTRDTPDPPGGQIVRDNSGAPTGVLLSTPNAAILYGTIAAAPALSPDQQRSSTIDFLAELNSLGITSAIDAAGGFQTFPDDYQVVMGLARDQSLSVRIAYNLLAQRAGEELADYQRWVTMTRPGDGDDWLRCNGAGENLVWAAADFECFQEPRPDQAPDMERRLGEVLKLLLENEWGFRIHATYDESIRRDLDVFEELVGPTGAWPARWFFDHAETVTPATLDRIAGVGGGISTQDRMAFQAEHFVARYGAPAAATSPPLRAILDRGIPLGAGSDATRVSSYNPWVSLAWYVTGRSVGGLQHRFDDELLTRAEALSAYTVGAAWFSGEEQRKGTLTPGKLADFVILSDDYFTVAEESIANIRSVLTVVGGRIVHASEDQTGTAAPLGPPSSGSAGGVRQAEVIADGSKDAQQHEEWTRKQGH
ncbi:MAG: amidohydrolase [Candidatus Dormiibacterota bacterium]